MEQLIGEWLGDRTSTVSSARYRIKALLGKQTGRRTFLAEDTQTERLVVVKLVLFGPDFTWEDLKLFEREAQTLKSLDHPAIPKYLDSFEVETPIGQGFAMVQAYIEAKSLQTWVGEGTTFSEEESRAIALELLNILKYLHHRQPPIIHRDIKPSNILLTAPHNSKIGKIYLIDFGSVQTTCASSTMTIAGTYGYMPPEQFGGRAQPASDLYSVGATLIYLATGKHPAELTQANLQIDFDSSHLSIPFSRWLKQLTYADLERRVSSASQASQQLAYPMKLIEECSEYKNDAISSSAILNSSLADLKVGTTERDFILYLDEFRTDIKDYMPKSTRQFPIWLEVSNGIAIICTFTSIYSVVILFSILEGRYPSYEMTSAHLWLGYLCCALLYLFIVFLGFLIHRLGLSRSRKKKMCRLSIHHKSNSTVFLSLARMTQARETGWIAVNFQKKNVALLSEKQLHSISITTGLLQDRVRFTFSDSRPNRTAKIDIRGSSQDIKWLYEHIKRWGRYEIETPWDKPHRSASRQ